MSWRALSTKAETKPRATISVGIASWDRHANQPDSVQTLFQRADTALYDAKRKGRNQIRLA